MVERLRLIQVCMECTCCNVPFLLTQQRWNGIWLESCYLKLWYLKHPLAQDKILIHFEPLVDGQDSVNLQVLWDFQQSQYQYSYCPLKFDFSNLKFRCLGLWVKKRLSSYREIMSQWMTKPTKRNVHPAKNYISLLSYAVWKLSGTSCSYSLKICYGWWRFRSAHRCAQADLSLHWRHIPS